jgi:putative alpha-1,2-mannosidase
VLIEYVYLLVGTDNDEQTVPGVALPFGFAQVKPDTTEPSAKYSTTGYGFYG